MLVRGGSEGFKRPLQDALAADVDPGTRSHLAVHDQAEPFQAMKLVVVGPVAHQVRVRQQHTRGVGMSAENTDRFARLHQQRFVVFQLAQASHDGMEGGPIPRGAPGSAVDDQILRFLRHVRIEVVHQHPQRGLLLPAFARDLAVPRGARMVGREAGGDMLICYQYRRFRSRKASAACALL